MNVRRLVSAVVASKLRIALVGVLLVSVSIGAAFAVGILGVPEVTDIDNTFGEVTNETTTIETDLVVSNPNPIGIGLDGVSANYTVSMNGVEMAHGQRDGVRIETGNSTMDLETQMRNDAIPPWWVTHIENDERTVIEIDATITSDLLGRSTDVSRSHEIETDLISAFNSDETRPVNANSPLTEDPVLYINETRGEWGTVSEEETPIEMEFVAYNPNPEPYAITELGYNITMNDVAVGEGRTQQGHVIPSYSQETIGLTTVLNNQRLDEWWVTHLDENVHGHQVSDLRIEFYAIVELPTGSEITVPLDEFTYEESIETDIFDEGGDVGEPTASDGDGSDTDGQDEETDSEEETSGDGSDDDSGDGEQTEDGSDGSTGDDQDEESDDTDGGDDDDSDDTDGDNDDGGDDDGVLPV